MITEIKIKTKTINNQRLKQWKIKFYNNIKVIKMYYFNEIKFYKYKS